MYLFARNWYRGDDQGGMDGEFLVRTGLMLTRAILHVLQQTARLGLPRQQCHRLWRHHLRCCCCRRLRRSWLDDWLVLWQSDR